MEGIYSYFNIVSVLITVASGFVTTQYERIIHGKKYPMKSYKMSVIYMKYSVRYHGTLAKYATEYHVTRISKDYDDICYWISTDNDMH